MKNIITILILLISSLLNAQTGPGGVGNNTSNRFWQDASSINQANGTQIASWVNNGGNALRPSQAMGANQPILLTNNINSNYASVSFDGIDDRLRIENTTDINKGSFLQRSYFVVFTLDDDIDITTRQIIFEQGAMVRGLNFYIFNGRLYCGAWNEADDGIGTPWGPRFLNQTIFNSSYIISFIYNGNDFISGTIDFYLNGSLVGTLNNVGRIYDHTEATLGGREGGTNYESGSSQGTGDHFQGQISEFIHFNYPVNSAQRIIIENYLAAKYDLTLSANDTYQQDNPGLGNYDNEVAGIGRVDDSNIHNDAQGTGIVRILNPTNLGDDEFLIWGHNNGVQQAKETTDVPSGVQARFARVWRVSEVNASNTAVDVGGIDVRFDLTGLGSVTASDLRLLVDTDNDGVFIDETPISGATSLGGDIYEFSGVTSIANNLRFTLGTILTSQTPLPIELVYLNAIPENGRSVKLDWQTASEINNDYFTIERSKNGFEWEEVSKINGAGNSTTSLSYSTIDEKPYLGVSYYRLKQTDFDGQFEYSQVKSVSFNQLISGRVEIYPNPTNDKITVVGSVSELSEVRVYNEIGQDVTNLTIVNSTNESIMSIDLSILTTGMYYIKTRTTANNVYKK